MFFSAGNPVLSVPNGDELEAAIEDARAVGRDRPLRRPIPSRHCDFVLPATTMYEREDFPLPFLALFIKPFIQMTEAVVEPRGEARQEWEVIEAISRRIGVVPSSVLGGPARWAGSGSASRPRRLVDLLLRVGPKGDLFGLRRGGLSVAKLARNPHGMVLAEHLAPDVMREQIRHRDRARPPRRARDPRGGRAPGASSTATTPTSRCG